MTAGSSTTYIYRSTALVAFFRSCYLDNGPWKTQRGSKKSNNTAKINFDDKTRSNFSPHVAVILMRLYNIASSIVNTTKHRSHISVRINHILFDTFNTVKMILHRWYDRDNVNRSKKQSVQLKLNRTRRVFFFVQVSHAFTKSYVGRSGHNGRQLVTIHTRNSMPSEMPSKRGVQRAELYTMGNQTETRWSLLSLSVLASRATVRDYHFSKRFPA